MRKSIFSLFFILLSSFSFSNEKKVTEFYDLYSRVMNEFTNTDTALAYAFDLLSMAESLQIDSLKETANIAISIKYSELNQPHTALKYAFRATELDSINTSTNKRNGMPYLHIAAIYSELENYPIAIKYFKKGLQNKIKYQVYIIATYANLSNTYLKLQQTDSSKYYIEKALAEAKKQNYHNFDSYIYSNLALLYLQTNQADTAAYYLKTSIQLLNSENDSYGLSQLYLELADIYEKQQNFDSTLINAKKAYQIAHNNHYKTMLTPITRILYRSYEQKSKYFNAFKFLKEYHFLTEQAVSDSAASKMAEMRAEYEISQNEAEMSYLKKISKTRANMLIIAGLGLLSILILSFFLYRQNKQRKFANYQLSESNEELVQKNEIINKQLEEKEILMKEIHHRVKNNLQIISSIINLQSMRLSDESTVEIFNEMQRRIMAISSIHQKLYQSESISVINMKEYLGEIVESIHSAFNNEQLNVSYQISVQNVNLDIDAAVSIGLIVNELTTNAYKYAFQPENENYFVVSLNHDNISTCNLTVQDSGPGVTDEEQLLKSNSLGLRMVNLLTRQMKGEIQVENQEGLAFSIKFKEITNKS